MKSLCADCPLAAMQRKLRFAKASNEKGSAEALPFPPTACKPALAGADKAVPEEMRTGSATNEKGSAEALPFPFETLERSQFLAR